MRNAWIMVIICVALAALGGGVYAMTRAKPTSIPKVSSIQPGGETIPSAPTVEQSAVPPALTETLSPTEIPSLTATLEKDKDSQRSPTDDMGMVFVEAGDFLMGNDAGRPNEMPAHTIYLDAFWIDKTEVTNAMYAKCVDFGTCRAPQQTSSYSRRDYFGNPKYNDYPVVAVLWEDANTYCSWAGRRLPTEAEWEKAARGKDGLIYPWGNEFNGAWVNFCDSQCPNSYANKSFNDGYADTAPVGSYPEGASPYGALDMAGNVWEWVNDWYGADYYRSSPTANPPGPTSGMVHSLRGGSWGETSDQVRVTWRPIFTVSPALYSVFGFRCAQDANP